MLGSPRHHTSAAFFYGTQHQSNRQPASPSAVRHCCHRVRLAVLYLLDEAGPYPQSDRLAAQVGHGGLDATILIAHYHDQTQSGLVPGHSDFAIGAYQGLPRVLVKEERRGRQIHEYEEKGGSMISEGGHYRLLGGMHGVLPRESSRHGSGQRAQGCAAVQGGQEAKWAKSAETNKFGRANRQNHGRTIHWVEERTISRRSHGLSLPQSASLPRRPELQATVAFQNEPNQRTRREITTTAFSESLPCGDLQMPEKDPSHRNNPNSTGPKLPSTRQQKQTVASTNPASNVQLDWAPSSKAGGSNFRAPSSNPMELRLVLVLVLVPLRNGRLLAVPCAVPCATFFWKGKALDWVHLLMAFHSRDLHVAMRAEGANAKHLGRRIRDASRTRRRSWRWMENPVIAIIALGSSVPSPPPTLIEA
ncbi:hypothetical protein NM208_g14388 [Fusarium decemcellulare]|uniref:Uncharacterized protein n=1 Tax=Fusarium decemcellulare TaxID=57161 RepID=A0ACC1RJP5_9HYPO|nr:hypothetical protein NM208_g14388 [Fusarium decemcellulare]